MYRTASAWLSSMPPGCLEIAVNKGVEGSGGGAARLFGVEYDDTVRVEFGDWAR